MLTKLFKWLFKWLFKDNNCQHNIDKKLSKNYGVFQTTEFWIPISNPNNITKHRYNNMKLNLSATILKFSKIIVNFLFSVTKVLTRLFLLPLIISLPIIIYYLQYNLDNNKSIFTGIIFITLGTISFLLCMYDGFMLFDNNEYSLKSFYKWIVNNAVYEDKVDKELEVSSIKEIEGNEYITGQWMNEKLNKGNNIPPVGNWSGN